MKKKEQESTPGKKHNSKEMEWLNLDEDELEEIEIEFLDKEKQESEACSHKAEKNKKTAVSTKAAKKAGLVKSRGKTQKKKHLDIFDRMIGLAGALIMVFAILTCSLYVNAKTETRQVASFEEIGSAMEGISVIGESGLLAIAEAQAVRTTSGEMSDENELAVDFQEKELNTSSQVEIEMLLSSMQKDLKIKFVNKISGKLVPNVPFEVDVTGTDGKSMTFQDDDMDGIIYQTDLTPGKCKVELKEIKDEKDIVAKAQSASVTIKDKIEYKKVDVTGEVKKESEVNAAVEDTKQQMTEVESVLTDTVQWVESTKTPISGTAVSDGSNVYEEVAKDKITDPMTFAGAFRFFKMAAPENPAVPSAEGGQNGDNIQTGTTGGQTVEGEQTGGNQEQTGGNQEQTGGNQEQTGGNQEQTGGNQEQTGGNQEQTGGNQEQTGGNQEQTGGNQEQTGGNQEQTGGTAGQETPAPPKEIKVSLDRTTYSMKTGESFTLNAVTDPTGNTVTWSSSNTAVVTVQSGVVMATGMGTASITAATTTGHSAVCNVTVTEPVKAKPIISISETGFKIFTEKTKQLTATVKDAEDKAVTWCSNNENVATVSQEGQVKGVNPGTAIITAVCNEDNSVSISCEVIVKANPESDNTTKLKDNEGNQLYIMESEGKYREAVYADYYKASKFYKKVQSVEYKYTGWQTIDGKTYYFDANGNKVTGEQVIQGAKYNFAGDGALSVSSGNMGIDVSKWNGNIDWNAVKNSGVSYVIIRCGYRGSTTGALIEDPKFRSNIKGATAAGLKVGIYFFTQAVNEAEAVEEASMVASLIAGYRISYPVFLDVEPSGGRADGISREARTAVCKAFCQTIQNSGYTAGIYANKTWLTSYINTGSLTNYKIWLAQYAAAPSYSATKYDMWQYSSKGSVAGISGNVDMNISYLGY